MFILCSLSFRLKTNENKYFGADKLQALILFKAVATTKERESVKKDSLEQDHTHPHAHTRRIQNFERHICAI